LARLGYVAGDAGPPRAYTPSLVEAVRRFQDNSGLVVDGVIGPGTLAMINKGPADRARQLAVNLERRRWLSRNPPDERIDVNLASGQLTYLHAGKVVWTSRVVAGAPGSATPLLQETFDRLIVNPPWNVPESIAQREILPKGPAYLQAHDMFVQEGRVVQRPGPDAALGQVKFDMQNRYAIYLHDTPAKALFERQERFFSHGCVRVENAVEFAQLLAGESGKAAEFDAALASGATRVVSLGRKIPVRLLYRTAFVDGDGEIAFRLDPYGLDNKVAEALGLGGNGRAVSISPELDLGP
jgi:murein L,D-transpeptidase YcbB/YkuD